jgi:TonB family protein
MDVLVALILAASSTTADGVLVPPKPLLPPAIAYPEDAPPIAEPIEVTVRIRVDEAGEVVEVELISGTGWPFGQAVLEGATNFRFEPGTYGGVPVTVDVRFTQRFEPPPRAPPPPMGVLAATIVERGTRKVIPFASVIARTGDVTTSTIADERGELELHLPIGESYVEIHAAGFRPFLQIETISRDEKTTVRYLIERESKNPYEVVVTTQLERDEVARTTLRGRDLSQVPGTFGDPFRVISTLPGVSQMMSLLPFPIVRGSSPGNTGFLIDGIRVPLLFHLLAGPSVIHPELIDEIAFSPGAFPAEYGGYTGGIVDGKTRAAGPDEYRLDGDINFLELGALVRRPIEPLGVTGTLAGRYGYPGFLLSLASPDVSLSYWDYQARVDGGGFTFFAFGARDELSIAPQGFNEEPEPSLRFHFHRVDLRYRHRVSDLSASYQLSLGYDDSLSQDEVTLESFGATPRIRFEYDAAKELQLAFGLDGLAKRASLRGGEETLGDLGDLLGEDGEPGDLLFAGGVFVEALYRPDEQWLIRPGVRADGYHDTSTGHAAIDPRLLVRYRATPSLWLKGGAGLYHQPPRFTIPVPGLDQIAFEHGLLESVQTTLGAELRFLDDWTADVQTYFAYSDPILYDVRVNPNVEDVRGREPTAPPGEAPPDPPRDRDDVGDRLDELLAPAVGRSYGVELLLRREHASGISGWLSYTLSRSERLRDGEWIAFDFDRTHILNLVLRVPLPRSWQLGLRAQVQGGRPLTTTAGLSGARTSPFVRFDLRIDKTAVWNDWLLDFYVDVANVVLGAEELGPESEVRYVLPSLGFRAIF